MAVRVCGVCKCGVSMCVEPWEAECVYVCRGERVGTRACVCMGVQV